MTERTRLTNVGDPAPDPSFPAPTTAIHADGQHTDHWILSDEDRAKSYQRPLRTSYTHVGPLGPQHPTRPLTTEEQARYRASEYVLFEMYPDSELPRTGRFWTQAQLDSTSNGCGHTTSMPQKIAETYAVKPDFYGSTFCAHCGKYLPVDHFVWDDGSRVGS